jgi:hypothetical protein
MFWIDNESSVLYTETYGFHRSDTPPLEGNQNISNGPESAAPPSSPKSPQSQDQENKEDNLTDMILAYEEATASEEFFVPYIWSVVVRNFLRTMCSF